jgi:hypothetical protein
MGGSLDYRTYDKALTKKQVEAKFDSDQESSAYEDGHSYSGQIGVMPSGIDWLTEKFKTNSEAEEYISEKHDKWDKAFGVRTEEGYVVGGWCSS